MPDEEDDEKLILVGFGLACAYAVPVAAALLLDAFDVDLAVILMWPPPTTAEELLPLGFALGFAAAFCG